MPFVTSTAPAAHQRGVEFIEKNHNFSIRSLMTDGLCYRSIQQLQFIEKGTTKNWMKGGAGGNCSPERQVIVRRDFQAQTKVMCRCDHSSSPDGSSGCTGKQEPVKMIISRLKLRLHHPLQRAFKRHLTMKSLCKRTQTLVFTCSYTHFYNSFFWALFFLDIERALKALTV